MEKKQVQFEQYWKPVEGMEDVQSLMTEFAHTAADELVTQLQEGKRMMITSFTNGGLNPLIYVLSELRKRYYEKEIPPELFEAISQHITLFETKTCGKPHAKKKEIITSTQYRYNRSHGDDTWQNPDLVVMVDDIVEGSTTGRLLEQEFPDIPKIYMVPVIKEVTHNNMEGNPHRLVYTRELANDWDDSGCGMNGGIFFKDLEMEEYYATEVLQRYSNTGYYHDQKDNQMIANLGRLHMNHMLERQLPWMHIHGMHEDLAELEELKNFRQHEMQLCQAEQLVNRVTNFTYDEALSVLTASY